MLDPYEALPFSSSSLSKPSVGSGLSVSHESRAQTTSYRKPDFPPPGGRESPGFQRHTPSLRQDLKRMEDLHI